MGDRETILIDGFNQEQTKKNFSPQQLLTSHEANWQNLVLEHHSMPASEMTEAKFEQHLIIITLHKSMSELKMDGHFKAKTYHKGDAILAPADMSFWCADLTDVEFIALYLDPQHLLHSNQELIKGCELELIPNFGEPDPFIYGLTLALKQELITNYYDSSMYAESLLNSLNVHLLHRYANKKPQIKNYRNGLAPHKLKQAINYINENLDKSIRLNHIAKLLGISTFYFCRLFRESMGVTPYKYVLQQRIAKAKNLAKNSQLSWVDIAYECGFSSQSQMTQHFRKIVGVTPQVYRNDFK